MEDSRLFNSRSDLFWCYWTFWALKLFPLICSNLILGCLYTLLFAWPGRGCEMVLISEWQCFLTWKERWIMFLSSIWLNYKLYQDHLFKNAPFQVNKTLLIDEGYAYDAEINISLISHLFKIIFVYLSLENRLNTFLRYPLNLICLHFFSVLNIIQQLSHQM